MGAVAGLAGRLIGMGNPISTVVPPTMGHRSLSLTSAPSTRMGTEMSAQLFRDSWIVEACECGHPDENHGLGFYRVCEIAGCGCKDCCCFGCES